MKEPDGIALTDGPQALTYSELNGRSNRLANYLHSLGVSTGDLVGLCLPRCLDMAVGALGILKAGAAYVPMDPANPADRLAFMLDDARAPVLITTPSVVGRLPASKREIVLIDSPEIAGESDHPPLVERAPGDLAYVIYTSGSTGKPKGVEITHASLANLVSWHNTAFTVSAADRASHLAGLGFDAAVWELWPYLATGASVHFVDEFTRISAERLRDWLLAKQITIGFVPTPLAERLLTVEWPSSCALRILLTGGDTLRRYPPPNLPFVLVNNYGPTECTVVATSGAVEAGKQIDVLPAIGRAIANTEIYILDRELRPTPIGTPGEIYIGGAGVARGYRNQPGLTLEKFIANPFSADPGSRLFRSGDFGRILPDGQIAFLGRVDDQIKIRGNRIEPNEIIGALNRHPDIRESLTVTREDTSGDLRLVAYLEMSPNTGLTQAGLREFLRKYLPDYMIPAVFVRVDSFPLSSNGKIDRAALPEPNAANMLLNDIVDVPRTPIERRVAEIVANLLELDEIDRNDNFFMLGGHSMLGAQLLVRLRRAFEVDIELRTLFDAPSVAALSAEIERLAANKELQLESAPVPIQAGKSNQELSQNAAQTGKPDTIDIVRRHAVQIGRRLVALLK